MYDIVYLAPFGRNFITDLIQLIGSTRPKYLGRPKLEFASSCERFDVWLRPKPRFESEIFRNAEMAYSNSIVNE